MKHKENLLFHLQNQTFSRTFTFEKKNDSLIILNVRPNETLATEYQTENTKQKGKKRQ